MSAEMQFFRHQRLRFWPNCCSILFHIGATLDIPIRQRDRSVPWGFGQRCSPPAAGAEALCTFPFIRPFQRTLSQLPSSSLPLNGGKGYKVSPQRAIQASVYSGNLTPAGVSASTSDCYRAVGEKESGRLEVRGKRMDPWFSERIQRAPPGPRREVCRDATWSSILIYLPVPKVTSPLSFISPCSPNQTINHQQKLKASRKESYQRGLCMCLAGRSQLLPIMDIISPFLLNRRPRVSTRGHFFASTHPSFGGAGDPSQLPLHGSGVQQRD